MSAPDLRELQILADVVGEGSTAASIQGSRRSGAPALGLEAENTSPTPRSWTARGGAGRLPAAGGAARSAAVQLAGRLVRVPGPASVAHQPDPGFRGDLRDIYLREDLDELDGYVRRMLAVALAASLLIGTAAALLAMRMGRLVVEPICTLPRRPGACPPPGARGEVVRGTQDEVGLWWTPSTRCWTSSASGRPAGGGPAPGPPWQLGPRPQTGSAKVG